VAVSVVENLVQRNLNLDLRLQLAQLYENTGQIAKAETEYEQILSAKKQPQGTSRQKCCVMPRVILKRRKPCLQAEKAAPPNSGREVRQLKKRCSHMSNN